MAFEDVTLLTNPTYKSLRFDGTYDDFLIVAAAADAAVAAGKLGRWDSRAYQVVDVSQYIITLVSPKGEEAQVAQGVWVVLTSDGNLEVYYDDKYRERLTLPEGEE